MTNSLPEGGQFGDVLMHSGNGVMWDSGPYVLSRQVKALEKICLKLMKHMDMTNQEKEQMLLKLKEHWLEKHPDCFTTLADGRQIFHQELLDLKHDMLLTQMYNKKLNMLPLWLCMGGLFILEIARVFI